MIGLQNIAKKRRLHGNVVYAKVNMKSKAFGEMNRKREISLILLAG